MHSDMSTIPIFPKIQIRLLEQFTITQITGSAQNVVSQGAVIPSLEMIQNHQKGAQRRVGLWPPGEELQCGRRADAARPGFSRVCTQPGLLRACQPSLLQPEGRHGCGWAWRLSCRQRRRKASSPGYGDRLAARGTFRALQVPKEAAPGRLVSSSTKRHPPHPGTNGLTTCVVPQPQAWRDRETGPPCLSSRSPEQRCYLTYR